MKLNLQRALWRARKMKEKGMKIGLIATMLLWTANASADWFYWGFHGSVMKFWW